MDANRLLAIEHGRRTAIAELLHRLLDLPCDFHWTCINEADALAVICGPEHRISLHYHHTPSACSGTTGADFQLADEFISIEVATRTGNTWCQCSRFGPGGTWWVCIESHDLLGTVTLIAERLFANEAFYDVQPRGTHTALRDVLWLDEDGEPCRDALLLVPPLYKPGRSFSTWRQQ